MAEFKYKVGEIVNLKSGGPDMTIISTATDNDELESYYLCRWHEKDKGFGEKTFIEESLTLKENSIW